MVLLIVTGILFNVPIHAQTPLDTLNSTNVTAVNDRSADVSKTAASTDQTTGIGGSSEDSMYDALLARINALFEKLNSLMVRVNSLMGRLANAKNSNSPNKPSPSSSDTSTSNPGTTKTTKDSQPTTNTKEAPNEVAAKVAAVASKFPVTYATKGSFTYAAGTENGNLGCANVVSAALREAGVPIKMLLGCASVRDTLLGLKAPNTWKKVSPPPYKPGDVIVWSIPPGKKHRHIGIAAMNGNSLMAMNNSSSKRHPVFSEIEHRAIECVLRKA